MLKKTDIEAQILEAGGTLSRTRRDCLDVLIDTPYSLDVEDLLLAVRARGRRVSRTTVTRFLSFLHQSGIAEIGARNNNRRYFKLKQTRRTISLRCQETGRLVQLEAETLLTAIEGFVEARGYRLTEGVCLSVGPALDIQDSIQPSFTIALTL